MIVRPLFLIIDIIFHHIFLFLKDLQLFYKEFLRFSGFLSDMKKMILKGIEALAEFIFPRICLICGSRLISAEKHLCMRCLIDMPQTYFWNRSHNPMADRFNEMIEKNNHEAEHYAYACALFFYHSEAEYRKIPYQLKYQSNMKIGTYFGKMLGCRLSASLLWKDVDMVIPVPLHRSRLWKRGYNQAEVIAAAIAVSLGVQMNNEILIRNRRTKTQTKVDVQKKGSNVSGAFTARKYSSDIHIRHILLVDDVFTTGSTLMACFTALRSVFPPSVRISVATLGFVGGA